MLNYLFKNLKGTDWAMLTEFVSPAFFDVVPAVGMAKVFGRIVKDYSNSNEFNRVKEFTRNQILPGLQEPSGRQLRLVDSHSEQSSINQLKGKRRGDFGNLILRLYFAQIFSGAGKSILDLRSSAFNKIGEWAPAPVFYQWSPDFKSGLQNLYRGFYEEDERLYQSGLTNLGLEHAEAIFRSHFGSGDQTAVTFSLTHLKESLHGVFLSCAENKSRLHPDFFALGVYLLCLYENLENLNVPLNVRDNVLETVQESVRAATTQTAASHLQPDDKE